MTLTWIQEVVFWITLFFTGYYTCYFKLEKKFKKELELKTEKYLRRIENLKSKQKE